MTFGGSLVRNARFGNARLAASKRVSYKTVPDRVSHKSVPYECPTRVSCPAQGSVF